MVKLRSRRLIRSPFSTTGGSSSNSNSNSNNEQQHQHRQSSSSPSSSSSIMQSSNSAAAAHFNGSSSSSSSIIQAAASSVDRDQRRPFESLPSGHSLANNNNSGNNISLEGSVVSPRGKRKPENRGFVTAGIRRAKTAVFRSMAGAASGGSNGGNGGNGGGNGNGGPIVASSLSNSDGGAAAARENNDNGNADNNARGNENGNEENVISRAGLLDIDRLMMDNSVAAQENGSNEDNNVPAAGLDIDRLTADDTTSNDDDYEFVGGIINNEPRFVNNEPPYHAAAGMAPVSLRSIQRTPLSQQENIPPPPPLAFPPLALSGPNRGISMGFNYGITTNDENDYGKAAYSAMMAVPMDVKNSAGSVSAKAPSSTNVVNNGNYTNGAVATKSTTQSNVKSHPPITAKNVLEWMREDAPPELLPKLLSFCGSRKMNALSRVNKDWNRVMKDESVWRVVCEDTHKWTNDDEIPNSWAQFYTQNPCVPIDYDTIDAAFDSISSGRRKDTIENNVMHSYREQRKKCRILLHPGPYFLKKPLVAHVVGNAELTIEAVSGVRDPVHAMTWRQNYHKPSAGVENNASGAASTPERTASSGYPLLPGAYHAEPSHGGSSQPGMTNARRPSSPTLRQIFAGCGGSRRSSSSTLGALDTSEHNTSTSTAHTGQSQNRIAFHQSCFDGIHSTALLCLESRRENEPVIRVRQGIVNIRGIKFLHYCEGTDIWNGNAAVQVQRAFGRNGRPLRVEAPNVAPTANVSDCDITSLSGRGLVVIDGAMSHIDNCNFQGSAATGVYVGGAGSMASMTRSDVVDNGTGNTRRDPSRRGVARGHSGVYVEQGLAKIQDCNISGNTLTGISAISTAQARLHIEESDIRGNRSDAMELPTEDSGRSVNRNNCISRAGRGRPRSERLIQSVVLETPRGRARREPGTPQSPLESDDDY